jgi:hypothetical protein
MNMQTNTTATLHQTNRINSNHNFKEYTMNHKSIVTVILSMMTVVALLIVTVSPVSANCVTVNQIRDRQELADYHGGSLSLGDCTTVFEPNPYDQINSRAELAAYQAAVGGQTIFVIKSVTVAEHNPFDQIENRAELAEFQAFIANQPIPHNEENDIVAIK